MQKHEDVYHQYVKMYFTTNQFTKLAFFDLNNKPHVARGLGNHYLMHFYSKLVHVTCTMHCIPCVCTQCISTQDKPWDPGVPPHQQPHYQLVKY